jgi:hypothetical protein
MNSINGQYTKMPVFEPSNNAVSAPAVSGAAKAAESSVTLDSVVVTISPEALKLQGLGEGNVSPQNGAGTLPPTEEPEPDEPEKGNSLPGVVTPLNGGGTLPPDPVKGKP